MNSDKLILHLCADVGSDSQPYKNAGYKVRCIGKDVGIENYAAPSNVYGIIANPVCTEFSVVRKGFHKDGDYEKGMFLVDHCKRIISECNPTFWVIENPATGRLKNFLGQPDFTYEPWMFGDPWTKKTALWGKFNHPKYVYTDWENVPKNDKLYIRPGRKKPGMAFFHKAVIRHIPDFSMFIDSVSSDMDFRSLCPQGFANAFFMANK